MIEDPQKNGQVKDPLTLLQGLLGKDTLMIPCRYGTKQPTDKKWQRENAKIMGDPNYRVRLAQGNIGVALGVQSNGLCTIDFDDQSAHEKFWQLNPSLKATLRTKAERGCNLWIKIVGEYPKNQKLKAEGKDIGEWRATGNQTVIYGKHPNGMDYKIINGVQPMTIPFEQINWPDNWNIAKHSKLDATTTPDTSSDAPQPMGTNNPASINTIEEAVLICLPKHERQNHRSLFQLARALLNVTCNKGVKLSAKDKSLTFEKWHANNPYLNPKNAKSDYREEFYEAIADARHPISEDPLDDAWVEAQILDLPNEHQWSEDVFLLQKLCHQLQTLRGPKPFFLGIESIVRLFDKFTKMHWHRKLKSLKGCGLIHEVTKGSFKSRRASEFIYVPHPVWTESEETKQMLAKLVQQITCPR